MDGLEKIDLDTRGLAKLAILTVHLPEDKVAQFGDVTATNVGRTMAMLIDGHMFLGPREVQEPITGGRLFIDGTFYMPPLRKLAGVINAGNLPAPVTIESHTVDGEPLDRKIEPKADTPVQPADTPVQPDGNSPAERTSRGR
jgi:hypothetical protein